MPTYVAKIRTLDGATREQVLSVPNEEQLEEYLSRVDGFIVDCSRYEQSREAPVTGHADVKTPRTRARVGQAEMVGFSWYLHTLLDAGVPLVKALSLVATQLDPQRWQATLEAIIQDLQRGENFADSLKKQGRFFPAHFAHLVEVGEVSGKLPEVLEQIAINGEKVLETRSKIKGAMTYPLILIGGCVLVTTFLIGYVLPKVASMFSKQDVELPWVTRLLLGIGNGLQQHCIAILATLVTTILGARVAMRVPAVKRRVAALLLDLPAFGILYQKYILASYCRTLALLNRAGVSMLQSLEIARNGVTNAVLADYFASVERKLERGSALGEELARSRYVPPMVSNMITVGEESGRLTDMLDKVVRFFERDIDQSISVLPKIIEPVVIVIMTGVVGLIAASVFIPLAELGKGFG